MAATGTGYGPADRYTRVAIGLHWAIATLILANLAIGLFADALKGVPLMPVHKAIGLTVLALSVVRLGWRLTHPAPPLPATVPGWQRATAHVTHFLLYALMILLPLSGWWMVSAAAERRPLDWFGLFPLPYLPVDAGGGVAHDAHGLLGWTMLILVLLHIGGALKHQVIDRDSVLQRMAPGVARR